MTTQAASSTTVLPAMAQQSENTPPAPSSLSWEGDKMFNIYIHDYCSKRGYTKTASQLLIEANIDSDPGPPINAKQGLLFEWWSVFWVLFSAKSTQQGPEDAMIYTHHQTIQRAAQVRQQPTTVMPVNAVGGSIPGGPQPGTVMQRPPGGPMINGVVAGTAPNRPQQQQGHHQSQVQHGPPGGFMPNGVGPPQPPFGVGMQPQQQSGGPVGQPQQQPQPNGVIPPPVTHQNPGQPQLFQQQRLQQQQQGQGPQGRNPGNANGVLPPFQSPTMSPQNPQQQQHQQHHHQAQLQQQHQQAQLQAAQQAHMLQQQAQGQQSHPAMNGNSNGANGNNNGNSQQLGGPSPHMMNRGVLGTNGGPQQQMMNAQPGPNGMMMIPNNGGVGGGINGMLGGAGVTQLANGIYVQRTPSRSGTPGSGGASGNGMMMGSGQQQMMNSQQMQLAHQQQMQQQHQQQQQQQHNMPHPSPGLSARGLSGGGVVSGMGLVGAGPGGGPGLGLGGGMDYTNEILSIPQPVLAELKAENGFPDKETMALSGVEKHRIASAWRARQGQGMRKPGNAAAGPSSVPLGMQPPNSQTQPPGRGRNKRSSTSPGEEHDSLPRNDNSPPDRKRVRRSPMGMTGLDQQSQPSNLNPQQRPNPNQSQTPLPYASQQQMGQHRGFPGMGVAVTGSPMQQAGQMQPQPHPMAAQMGGGSMQGQMQMNSIQHNRDPLQYRIPIGKTPGPGQSNAGSPIPHGDFMSASNSQFQPAPFSGGVVPRQIGQGQQKSGAGGPPGMMPPPPPSPAMGGKDKDSSSNKGPDASPRVSAMQAHTPVNGTAATPTSSGSAPNNNANSASNNNNNASNNNSSNSNQNNNNNSNASSMTLSPQSLAPLVTDDMFSNEFMQNVATGLDGFDATLFGNIRGPDNDINFERDFGQWFNPEESVSADLK